MITRLTMPRRETGAVRWALLADPHVPADPAEGRPPDYPVENLRAAVEQVLDAVKSPETAPAAAMILGDVAWRHGLPEDYAQAASLIEPLAARLPVCLTLGNHDERENFLAAFPPQASPPSHAAGDGATPKSIIVVEHAPVRFVILDSQFRGGVVGGLLGFEQRAWLRRFLDGTPPVPTILAMHHALDDNDKSLFDAEQLVKLIAPFRQVKAIVHGHWHEFKHEVVEGIHDIQLPAVGIPLADGIPIGWLDAVFTSDGAEFTMRSIGADPPPQPAKLAVEWR